MVPRNDIRDGVDTEMAQVELARRIREHRKNIHMVGGALDVSLMGGGRGRGVGGGPVSFELSVVAPSLAPFPVQGWEVELRGGIAPMMEAAG